MKTIKEIKAEMTSAILGNEELSLALDLNPETAWEKQVSAASVIDILLTIIATTYYALNWMFETYKEETTEKVRAVLPGTVQWYYEKAMAFRYGESVNEDGIYETELADDSVRIVKMCSVVEEYGGLLIKVSKDNLVPLTGAELDAFRSYMYDVKFAGVQITVISSNPDTMNISINIKRNAMTLPSVENDAKPALITAITDYLIRIQPGGILNKTQLTNAMLAVDGIEDVVIVDCYFTRYDGLGTVSYLVNSETGYDVQNYNAYSAGIALDIITVGEIIN